MKSTLIPKFVSKRILSLFVGLGLILYSVPLTFAASVYQVSPSSGTVGSSISSIELEYTVDTSQQTWADNDTLIINLPPNIGPTGWNGITFSVEFDEDVNNDGTAETPISAGGGPGQYSTSGPDLTIRWNETAWSADNSDTLRVLIANNTPQYANASTNFNFSGTTVAGGDTNPSGVASMNISQATEASASVTLGGNSVVAASGNTTVTFNPLVNISNTSNDRVIITFPAGFNVSSAAYSSTSFAGATFSCTPSGQVVTCVMTAGTIVQGAGSGSIVLSGITTLYAFSTDVTSILIQHSNINNIVTDSTVATTDVTAADASASATLAGNSVVGGTGNAVLSLTLPLGIVSTDTIAVTFPDNLDVSDAALSSETLSGTLSGCSAATQTVTCTANASSNAGSVTITLSGISARYAASSQTITNVIVRSTGVSANIATDASGSITDTTETDAAASVTLDGNDVGGEEGTTTVTFTTPVDLAADDTVEITFPSYMDVSGASYDSDTFAGAGAFTCASASQVVTCTATGAITAGTGTIVLSGILGSEDGGTTDISLFVIQFEGVDGQLIAQDTVVALTDVTEPARSSGSVPPPPSGHGSTSSNSSSSSSEDSSDENPFSDLDSGDDYYDAIMDLYDRGVIGGYPDGTIQEEAGMNRAELMKIVVLAVTDEPDADLYSNCYSDVTDEWFAPYVCYATEQGWISGYPDGTFRPGDIANNAEILKMILNTNGVEVADAQDDESWYSPYVSRADELGLISEEYFMPGDVALRGYAFQILSTLLNL